MVNLKKPAKAASSSDDGAAAAASKPSLSSSAKTEHKKKGIAKKSKGKRLAEQRHEQKQQEQNVAFRILSANQRKRERKREKKREEATLQATQSLDGMKASLEELLDHNETQQKQEWKTRRRSMTSKARSRIVVQETAHLKQVLDHPAFKTDPIAALSEHVRNIVDASNAEATRGWQPQHQQAAGRAGGGFSKKRMRD